MSILNSKKLLVQEYLVNNRGANKQQIDAIMAYIKIGGIKKVPEVKETKIKKTKELLTKKHDTKRNLIKKVEVIAIKNSNVNQAKIEAIKINVKTNPKPANDEETLFEELEELVQQNVQIIAEIEELINEELIKKSEKLIKQNPNAQITSEVKKNLKTNFEAKITTVEVVLSDKPKVNSEQIDGLQDIVQQNLQIISELEELVKQKHYATESQITEVEIFFKIDCNKNVAKIKKNLKKDGLFSYVSILAIEHKSTKMYYQNQDILNEYAITYNRLLMQNLYKHSFNAETQIQQYKKNRDAYKGSRFYNVLKDLKQKFENIQNLKSSFTGNKH